MHSEKLRANVNVNVDFAIKLFSRVLSEFYTKLIPLFKIINCHIKGCVLFLLFYLISTRAIIVYLIENDSKEAPFRGYMGINCYFN